jgi:hypothetical protein
MKSVLSCFLPGFSKAVIGLVLLSFVASGVQAQTFTPRRRLLPVGPNPSAIAAQDLNGDEWPEIITADRGELTDPREERPANDELSLLIAQGNLEYVRHHPSLKTGFAPYDIVIANVDSLKWPDILVANFQAVRHRNIMIFLNIKPENLFKPVPLRVPDDSLSYVRQRDGDGMPLFTQPGLTSLAVRDFNGNGFRDIIATGWASDVLVFFPGAPEILFGDPQFIHAPGGPRDLALADFDGDGHTDLAVAMYSTSELTLWKGDGQGHFLEMARFPTRGRLPTKVRAADLDRDGKTDLVVSHCYTDDTVVIFYGDGGFRFSVSQEIMLGKDRETAEQEIRDILVEDLTGNSRPDIAAACYGSGEIAVLINTGGEGNAGAGRLPFRRETYSFENSRPRALCAVDLTRNGKKDIAVALWQSNAVGLLINRD